MVSQKNKCVSYSEVLKNSINIENVKSIGVPADCPAPPYS